MRSDSGSNPSGAMRASRLTTPHGVAVIRDQRPMPPKTLELVLDGMTPSEWYQLGKTFLGGAREMLEFLVYRARAVPVDQMLQAPSPQSRAPFNPAPRLAPGALVAPGPSSVSRTSLDDPHSHVVDAVTHHVPDIADLRWLWRASRDHRFRCDLGRRDGASSHPTVASRVSGIPVRSANPWLSGEQRLLRNAQPLLPLGGLVPVRAVGAVPPPAGPAPRPVQPVPPRCRRQPGPSPPTASRVATATVCSRRPTGPGPLFARTADQAPWGHPF